MEIKQLEAFLEVATRRSFGKAAMALFITQPALSARIKALESELGQLLFSRLKGRVGLTEAGVTLLPFAEKAINTLHDGRQALKEWKSAAYGKLNIGSAPAISTYVLPNILETYHARYPNVELSVTTGHSHQILDMVLREDVQVGLTRSLHHPNINATHLYTEPLVLVAHPSHSLASSDPVTIPHIGREPLIMYDRNSSHYALINETYRQAGIVPKVVMYLDSIEAAKKMVLQGLGISYLPKSSLEHELQTESLISIELDANINIELQTSVLHLNGRSAGVLVQAFFNVLGDTYGINGLESSS